MRDNFIVNKDFTGLPFGFQGVKFLTVQDRALSWSPASKSESHSVLCNSATHGLYSPWSSPGQNTGVGSHSLHQGIFPTHGIEPRSPTLQADSLPAEPPGKPYQTTPLMEMECLLTESTGNDQPCPQGQLACESWSTREEFTPVAPASSSCFF